MHRTGWYSPFTCDKVVGLLTDSGHEQGSLPLVELGIGSEYTDLLGQPSVI